MTESQQADFVGASFSVLAKTPYVEAAIIYNLREKGDDPSSHEDNFGLVSRDFTPKPAYAAFRRALGGTTAPPPRVTLRLRLRGRFAYAYGTGPKRGRARLAGMVQARPAQEHDGEGEPPGRLPVAARGDQATCRVPRDRAPAPP